MFFVMPFLQEFDTVLAATGRKADVAGLGLEKLGAKLGTDGKVRFTGQVH